VTKDQNEGDELKEGATRDGVGHLRTGKMFSAVCLVSEKQEKEMNNWTSHT